MGRVLTRAAWNDLIRRVNDKSQHPAQGCDPLGPLNEIGSRHIWTAGDVYSLRGRLHEICGENVFLEYPGKWKQSLITEISDALDVDWCDCAQIFEPYDILIDFETKPSPLNGSSTHEFVRDEWSSVWYGPNCPCVMRCPQTPCTSSWSYSGIVFTYGPVDFQVGPPGITNRRATVKFHVSGVDYLPDPVTHESDQTYWQVFPIGEDGWLHIADQLDLWTSGIGISSGQCPDGCTQWPPPPQPPSCAECPYPIMTDWTETIGASVVLQNLRLSITKPS